MGDVRITSGYLRGRLVRTPEGEGTRPLLTRVRKSLADLLRPRLAGARVLDLFGGSGAIALECLSNGAAAALVVELHRPTAALIRANAAALGVAGAVTVIEGDGVAAAADLARRGESFDLVMVAPPYGHGLHQRILDTLAPASLRPGGLLVVQRDVKEPVGRPPEWLALERTRAYGRTVFDFYVLR